MNKENKPRSKNFSDAETLALLKAVEKHADIISGKYGTGVSKESKKAAWNEIVRDVNAVGSNSRTLSEIETKYKNYKASTKKILCQNSKEVRKTGGGKGDVKDLTESQEIMSRMIPPILIEGIPGGIDSGEKRKRKFEGVNVGTRMMRL